MLQYATMPNYCSPHCRGCNPERSPSSQQTLTTSQKPFRSPLCRETPKNSENRGQMRSNGVYVYSGRSWARWPRLRSNEASIPIVGRSPCPPQTLIPPQMSSRSPLGAKHPRTVQWASRSNGESNWTCVTLLHILTSYLNRKEKCQLDISTPRAHASRV
jgi:hypothetical protein